MGLVRQSPSGCFHSQKFLPLLLIDLFSFYLYRLLSDPTKQPIILVPTKQFESFLWNINRKLGTSLRIPTGSKGAFYVTFDNDGTPQPRYLGRATNREVRDLTVFSLLFFVWNMILWELCLLALITTLGKENIADLLRRWLTIWRITFPQPIT
jgi:hypothetical protein